MRGLPDVQPNHIRGVGLVAQPADADLDGGQAELNDLEVMLTERVEGSSVARKLATADLSAGAPKWPTYLPGIVG